MGALFPELRKNVSPRNRFIPLPYERLLSILFANTRRAYSASHHCDTVTMSTPRRVCIVGAGPAGLTTAKTFLQYHGFSVTVFETADRVGGMWRAREGETGDKCDPEMRTNLSRFTVAFSDLDWHCLFPPDQNPDDNNMPAKIPLFPRAHEVGKYLGMYSAKFGLEPVIQLNTKVVKASLDDTLQTWTIITQDMVTEQLCTREFDYLVIASGFFDKPGRSFDPSLSKSLPNMQHSSRFRKLSSLSKQAGKIVVIGGGISGSEAASSAALQVSSAGPQPDRPSTIHADSRIYHVINRPFYILPRYLPARCKTADVQASKAAPTFLPIDLVLYDLSRRGNGEISAVTKPVPPEIARKGHGFLRSLLGGDQSDLGFPELVYKEAQMQYPPYTGITDTYAEFVRSGIIVPVQGWVEEVKQRQDTSEFDILLKQYDPWHHAQAKKATGSTIISNVVGIIEATGYRVDLEYLDSAIKDRLDYDPLSSRIPFIFTHGSTTGLPNLAAVGFYEGPYWGVMELQARYIAETWTKDRMAPDNLGGSSKPHSPGGDDVRIMRAAMRDERALHVPQLWMSDYVGFVEQFARVMGITRADKYFGPQRGPVFPARYRSDITDPDGAAVTKEVNELTIKDRGDLRLVASAVFRGLQGVWSFNRKINSHSASSPGCSYSGTAHFRPRVVEADAEYLYQEDSTFESDNGFSFGVTRSYIYTCFDEEGAIYQKLLPEDEKEFRHPYYTWKFHAPGEDQLGWLAHAKIREIEPETDYLAGYEFRFRGAKLETFCIDYQVKGPDQDYTHKTWYLRPKVKKQSQDEL